MCGNKKLNTCHPGVGLLARWSDPLQLLVRPVSSFASLLLVAGLSLPVGDEDCDNGKKGSQESATCKHQRLKKDMEYIIQVLKTSENKIYTEEILQLRKGNDQNRIQYL